MVLDKICQIIILPTKDDPNHKLWLNKETNSLWFDNHGKVSSRFEDALEAGLKEALKLI